MAGIKDHMRRGMSAGLAFLLLANPVLAAATTATTYDETLARYLRGEASLGEVEEARRAFQRESIERSVATQAPDAGEGEDRGSRRSASAPRAPEGAAEDPSTLGKIAAWVRDIPKRFTRRFVADDKGFERPEDIEKHIDTSVVKAYTANAAQREADSTWVRPVKVTAKNELNKVQSVIERVVGFGGMAALAKALSGDRQAQQAVQTATKVVAKLGAAEKQTLIQGLSKSGLGKQISQLIGGKPTSAFGKVVKDQFGNNLILAVAASGLVSAFLNDGLDLDTLKDHLVALNAVESRRTHRENLIALPLETIAFYHMDRGATSLFNSLWTKVTSGTGGLAGWLTRSERAISAFGQSIVKTPPPHLAAKAAELTKTASSLGLPGVSGATALTLRGAAEAMFKAGTLGLVGIPLINGGWKVVMGFPEGMVIGGNRGKTYARYDLFYNYYQRTGSKVKDAVEERRMALNTFIDDHRKFPASHFLNYFARMAGGYMGAVVASTLLAPTGILGFGAALVVSAIFSEGLGALGTWLGAKMDTSPRFYRRLYKNNAEDIFESAAAMGVDLPEKRDALATLAELDRARARLRIRSRADLARVQAAGGPAVQELEALAARYADKKQAYMRAMADLADDRANDWERLMKVSQVNHRIHFVRAFEDITLEQRDDGYTWIVCPGFEAKASPRYDFVDAEGRRGVWDYKTNRILDVGFVSHNNGKRITFLDDESVDVKDGVMAVGYDPETSKGEVVVTKDGIIMERGPKREWLLRGYGGEYDIVLRTSGRRFAWDDTRFVEVGTRAHEKLAAGIAEKAVKDAKAQAFSDELKGDLVAKTQSRRRRGDVDAALIDLGRLARAKGASSSERFTAVMAASVR